MCVCADVKRKNFKYGRENRQKTQSRPRPTWLEVWQEYPNVFMPHACDMWTARLFCFTAPLRWGIKISLHDMGDWHFRLVMIVVWRTNTLSSVVDPGFPRGGANSRGRCQPIIWPNFPKNWMKMKKFGSGGGHKPKILLCGSTTEAVEALITLQYVKWYLFVKWGEQHTERYLPRSTWCKYIYKKRFLNQICTGTFTHKSAFYGIRTSF